MGVSLKFFDGVDLSGGEREASGGVGGKISNQVAQQPKKEILPGISRLYPSARTERATVVADDCISELRPLVFGCAPRAKWGCQPRWIERISSLGKIQRFQAYDPRRNGSLSLFKIGYSTRNERLPDSRHKIYVHVQGQETENSCD